MSKKAKSKKHASKKVNNVDATSSNVAGGVNPHFTIIFVERDIFRGGLSTEEICQKYGKREEEVNELIKQAYCRKPARAKSILQALKQNDINSARQEAARERRAEKAETVQLEKEGPVKVQKEEPDMVQGLIQIDGEGTDICQKVGPEVFQKEDSVQAKKEKTPLELQQEVVELAADDVNSKLNLVGQSGEDVRRATYEMNQAEEELNRAKEAFLKAQDKLMSAQAAFNKAEEALQASSAEFDIQLAKLNEMSTRILLHISAVKEEIPYGEVYMSAYDYAKLTEAQKECVTPIATEGTEILKYPADFYLYPAKMDLDSYSSACHYVLAYIKLLYEEQEATDLELVCEDKLVKELASMQAG